MIGVRCGRCGGADSFLQRIFIKSWFIEPVKQTAAASQISTFTGFSIIRAGTEEGQFEGSGIRAHRPIALKDVRIAGFERGIEGKGNVPIACDDVHLDENRIAIDSPESDDVVLHNSKIT